MKYIRSLSSEKFDKVKSFINNSEDDVVISEFKNAPCYKASRSRYDFTWHSAPETTAFGQPETRFLWKVDMNKYRASIWEYRQNVYVLVDFDWTLYRWKFSRDFAKKIGLV